MGQAVCQESNTTVIHSSFSMSTKDGSLSLRFKDLPEKIPDLKSGIFCMVSH